MEQRTAGVLERTLKQRPWRSRAPEPPTIEEPISPAPATPGRTHVTVIESSVPSPTMELRELWRARETAFMFAWRDVKVRYKQSLIGIGWAIIQPFLTMVIFSYIFGHFARFPSQGLTYPVFVYLGILPWTFFSTALTQISGSVLNNRQLVQKVYFPRLIMPISGLLVPMVDFVCSAAVLAGMMVVFHVGVGLTLVLAPLFLLWLALIALGVGATLAAINVRFRDVPFAVPFLISIWMYLSPVIYPSASLPHRWRVASAFNPVVGAVTGFRWSIGGTPGPSALQLGAGLAMTAFLASFGIWFYRKWESRFADQL